MHNETESVKRIIHLQTKKKTKKRNFHRRYGYGTEQIEATNRMQLMFESKSKKQTTSQAMHTIIIYRLVYVEAMALHAPIPCEQALHDRERIQHFYHWLLHAPKCFECTGTHKHKRFFLSLSRISRSCFRLSRRRGGIVSSMCTVPDTHTLYLRYSQKEFICIEHSREQKPL